MKQFVKALIELMVGMEVLAIRMLSEVVDIPSLYTGVFTTTLYFCMEYNWDWRYYTGLIILGYLFPVGVLLIGKTVLPERRVSIEKAAYLLGGNPLKNFIFPEE